MNYHKKKYSSTVHEKMYLVIFKHWNNQKFTLKKQQPVTENEDSWQLIYCWPNKNQLIASKNNTLPNVWCVIEFFLTLNQWHHQRVASGGHGHPWKTRGHHSSTRRDGRCTQTQYSSKSASTYFKKITPLQVPL